ncbi:MULTISPECIES: hypothetical protein [unclassified Streptomyces]|uniref:hypothetical protein n=1 Tax=unclassified Streptomyces TaxID=2593676 RepID=UPI0020256615|nr:MULTISPECIES: hypothetical protein [unclassified Streptomyces]MCX4550595.1 hypothetical protein [Streptomyces sp. NBC_01500]WSC22040.1 hypothetical protein OIE60_21430 [Streptomyces sp. NBC_01766]
MAERLHHVDLCQDCGGLRTAVLEGIDVTGFKITYADGSALSSGPARIYVGPAEEPCPQKEAGCAG